MKHVALTFVGLFLGLAIGLTIYCLIRSWQLLIVWLSDPNLHPPVLILLIMAFWGLIGALIGLITSFRK